MIREQSSYFADGQSIPDLMTEKELVHFLRIPEVSSANDYHNVVDNLVKMRDLPVIHICNRRLYPKKPILDWIEEESVSKKKRFAKGNCSGVIKSKTEGR